MNKNANVAAVIRLTRATKKAQRKKTLYLEGLQWKWDVLELQTSINSRLIYNHENNVMKLQTSNATSDWFGIPKNTVGGIWEQTLG